MYKEAKNGVVRLSDGACIMPNTHDWQKYQTWLADGNTPEPADPEPDPEVVAAQAKLIELDIKSIRGLREYVAAQPDAPQALKGYEAQAVVWRKKVK